MSIIYTSFYCDPLLSFEITKKQTKYETIVFKRLDIKQQSTLIPERKGTSEVSPIVASTYSLEGVQAMMQGVEIRMGSLG